MRIIGTGIDIVVIKELLYLLERSEGRFEARCFTSEERHMAGKGAHRIKRLAETFAAKEAVLKALGTGWSQGISWMDIEVLRSSTQEVLVILCGRAKEIASDLGISEWKVCVSHSKSYAVASVIALSNPDSEGLNAEISCPSDFH